MKRILFVDDNPDILLALIDYFSNRDWITDSCGNGTTALNLLSTNEYDILVLDVTMPISNFGSGLQKALSYLPSTYATSLIKNHMLHGVFMEMERKHYPDEMVEAIRATLDCNPVFHGNVVGVNQMIGIMMGSIAVFGIIYYFVTLLPDGEGGR